MQQMNKQKIANFNGQHLSSSMGSNKMLVQANGVLSGSNNAQNTRGYSP
jgi:hypothetical protein